MNRLFDLEQEVTRVRHRGQRSRQASIQLAIDGVGYVTKTEKGGAFLHSIETNQAGNITNVKSVKGRTRVPTGAQVSVDTGKTKDEYVWAQYNNQPGAIRKSSIVMLAAAAVPATVGRSDVKVTDTGIQEQSGTRLYSITPRVDGSGKITAFLESGEIKTLPLGTKISIQPGTRSSNDDNIWWAMQVSETDIKVGAVNRGDVVIASQLQNIPAVRSFSRFFEACWTTPWLKALYRGFLRTQFNSENLDFLSAVAQIKNQTQAQHVIDLFVKTGSNREVNLSGGNRGTLIDAITNPPQNYADWRIPFGYDEQNGTTFADHIRPPAAANLQDARGLVLANPCKQIYDELGSQSPKPDMKDANMRKLSIEALIKDPNG